MGQIFLEFWTNIFFNLDKYNVQEIVLDIIILRQMPCPVDGGEVVWWLNTIWMFDKYILLFGQINFAESYFDIILGQDAVSCRWGEKWSGS